MSDIFKKRICTFWLNVLFFFFMLKIRIIFREQLYSRKGLLLASNHFSNLDPPFLFFAWPGLVSFVAKKELFSIPYLGTLISDLGMIGVNRESFGPSTVKKIGGFLAERNVLMFPEGTRSRDGEIGEGKPGFGFLVSHLEADVVPVYIDSFRILPRNSFFPVPGTVKIIFGRKLTFQEISAKIDNIKEKSAYEKITAMIMDEISQLKSFSKEVRD